MIKTTEIGYINLNKETPIPETIQDIRLFASTGGPVNTAVLKPFRSIVTEITVSLEEDTKSLTEESKQAILKIYQDLLTEARRVVSGAKGRFVMYLNQEQAGLSYRLVGKVYKL
ncbi:MAG: hypothetical protein EHM64_00040 [Ignavibacteriae bacterium]|nr:MAG: hypothetical protein EHM64_00040 [Ignavibacteriota bacterium]